MAKKQRRRRQERRREHARREGWRTQHSMITGAGLAAGAALGLAPPALAASQNFYVGTTADTNTPPPGDCTSSTNTDCTLRQVITLANANSAQGDYIYFRSGLTGTIALTAAAGGQISISDATYIYGPGPDQIAVSAAPSARIFDIDPATAGDRVEIDGLTLTGGNVASEGGAIRNDDARLVVLDAVLTGNTAGTNGGAIYESSNYDNGQHDFFGYATFSGNHAGNGGAVAADLSWGVIRSSTFSGNSADSGYAGAIGGTTGYVIDSTVSGNTATTVGGGVSTGQFYMYGTILANNTAPSNPDLAATGGYVGYDLVENPGTTGIGVVPSVITGQDPQLGSLQSNGGDTPTFKPAASSPVVDQSYSLSYYDQRIGTRIVDNPNRSNAATGPYAGADIGSVELTLAEGPQAQPATPTSVPAPAPAPFNLKKAIKKCKKKFPGKAKAKRRKKCIKKAKRRARASSNPWAQVSRRWVGAADRIGPGHHAFRVYRP